jgi:hypothetical protein
MHQKTIAAKLLILLSVLVGNSACWAESRQTQTGNASGACHIENRVQDGYSPPKVIEFGDFKIKVVEEGGVQGSVHYAIFDLKAPGYIKRGVRLEEGKIFTDTICGTDVSIQMRGPTQLLVSSF